MRNKISLICAEIVGIIFLISGFAKATDCAAFETLLTEYGHPYFALMAYVVILSEIILGLTLIYRTYLRLVVPITIAFLVAATSVFTYGYLVLHITNCGCFGPITALNTSPTLTYIRNGLMLAMLIWMLVYPTENQQLTKKNLLVMALAVGIAAFTTGYTMKGVNFKKGRKYIPVVESGLTKHITFNSDSTYLVFAFSYTCPYCLSSVENAKQYQQMGVVSKVIGLVIEDDVQKQRFNQLFEWDYPLIEIPKREMAKITNNLPTAFLIKNDTIRNVQQGFIMSAAIYLKDDKPKSEQ